MVGSLTGQPEPEPKSSAGDADGSSKAAAPPTIVRQKSLKEQLEAQLEGVVISKPLVCRQPSGICAAVCEECPHDTAPPLKHLPSHDKGLLAKAYA